MYIDNKKKESGFHEEELICWSATSLRAPLNHAGLKRFLEVFEMVFPEKYKEVEKVNM